jgi:P-type Cu+ transporter
MQYATDHDDQDDNDHGHAIAWQDLARIAFAGVALVAVWLLAERYAPVSLIAGIVATLIAGWPIFKEALENLLERRMTMELSMTIALVAALAIGQVVTTLVIGNPNLVAARCGTIREMELANLFCWLVDYSQK